MVELEVFLKEDVDDLAVELEGLLKEEVVDDLVVELEVLWTEDRVSEDEELEVEVELVEALGTEELVDEVDDLVVELDELVDEVLDLISEVVEVVEELDEVGTEEIVHEVVEELGEVVEVVEELVGKVKVVVLNPTETSVLWLFPLSGGLEESSG